MEPTDILHPINKRPLTGTELMWDAPVNQDVASRRRSRNYDRQLSRYMHTKPGSVEAWDELQRLKAVAQN